MALRRSSSRRRRACALASISVSKKWKRPRPSSFARYNAMSAFFNSWSAIVAVVGRNRNPNARADDDMMVAEIERHGSTLRRCAPPRQPTRQSAAPPRTCTIENSSPPVRETRSPSRTSSRRRLATAHSNASPTEWPSVSLTTLNCRDPGRARKSLAAALHLFQALLDMLAQLHAVGQVRSARRDAPGTRSASPSFASRSRPCGW